MSPSTQFRVHKYSIADEVFKLFPGYVRGVVLAYGVTNRESPPELTAQLRAAEDLVRQKLVIDTIAESPFIKPWREAFRAFGAKPSEFRPSIEAMARRVLRGDNLPSINALVDIGNTISLRHLVSAGGHSLDMLQGDIALRVAKGDEVFVPFGEETPESPLPGEIIFAEGDVVLTRRWVWRQSNHTLTVLSTRNIEFNIDGFPPVTPETVKEICQETADMVKQYCGGQTSFEILSPDSPTIEMKFQSE